MSVMVEFSVVPIGKGVSLSPVIARILKIVVESGVHYRVNPMGTVIEGEWDVVMGVVKKCHHEALSDAERVVTTIKIDDRLGGEIRMDKKLKSLEQALGVHLKK